MTVPTHYIHYCRCCAWQVDSVERGIKGAPCPECRHGRQSWIGYVVEPGDLTVRGAEAQRYIAVHRQQVGEGVRVRRRAA